MTEEDNEIQPIPERWIWTEIGEISEIITGCTPSKKNPENYGYYMPFVKPPQLLDDVITEAEDNLSKRGVKLARVLPPKSILVSCIGNLGKTGINKIPVAFNQQINAIILPKDVVPEFLFYYFQTAEVKRWLYKVASATTIPIVNKSKFSKAPIPLAPLPEQGRIVGKLEGLFTRLDAGVESLRNVKAQLQLYRQAVLNHAFNGKLTEEWRKTHKNTIQPATTLLEQIRQERKKKEKEKYREPPKIDTTNLPELPETWTWTRIIDIGEVVTGKTPKKSVSAYYSDTYPFFKPADLNSGFYVKASIDGLSDEGIKQSRLLPAKSTLVTCIGATIGKTGFIRVNGASNQQINAIIPCKNIVPEFVYFYCISPQFQKEIMNNYSSTTLPILNKSKFQKLHVALPSYLEQKRITEELESYFSTVDNIEKIVEKNLLWSERLRQSILKIAFEGGLVAQDPSDEPVDVLLERIKQEKEKQSNQKKKRTRSRRRSRKRSQRRLNGHVE